MDKLQHIDELLKSSASSFANGLEVGDNDWLAVERKLKQRKNRIYAVWFFLALIVASSTLVLINNITSTSKNSIVEQPDIQQNLDNNYELPDLINESTNKSKDATISLDHQVDLSKNQLPNTTQTDVINQPNDLANDELQQPSGNQIPQKSELDLPFVDYLNNSLNRELIIVKSISKSIITDQLDLVAENTESFSPISPVLKQDKPFKNNPDNDVLKGYWEAGVSFTPSISGKFISENSQLAGLINRSYYSKVANGENAAFSNSAGLNAQYHLPTGWFMSTGLFIAQRTEALDYKYTITEYPRVNNNEITGYSPLSQAAYINVAHSGSNSYHFVEIPLNVGYKQSISSKFELRGQLGMSYLNLFNLNGLKADYTSLELKNLENFGFNQNNLAANAKMGLYLNKKNFVVGIEPIFNYNITSLSDASTAINIKPYSYGLNISTNYKFKN